MKASVVRGGFWLRIGNRVAKTSTTDWLVLVEGKGYLCSSDGKPLCWIAKYAADVTMAEREGAVFAQKFDR